MGPFIKSNNTKFKVEMNIVICLILLTLFSTYKSIITLPSFGIKSFYPIVMVLVSIICSFLTSFIYSKITKNDLKSKPNIIPSILFPLMLGINVPIYLVIIGSIIIEILNKVISSKLYFINFTLIVGLLILGICYFVLKINPYLYDGELNIISNLKDIGTYESLITPYGGFKKFLFGLIPSVIGGCSLICILSLVYLSITKCIKYRIGLSIVITISIISYFTGNFSGIGNWYILYILFTSSTLFGVLLASLNNNTPVTPIGQVLYGIFIGILTIIIRYFVSFNEAIFISILLIGFLIPIFDKVGAKARFHINKCLPLFTIAWVLIIIICFYMFVNFKNVDEFKIVSKDIKNEITEYVVSNENNIGKIVVNVVVDNKKITKFDIVESTDKNAKKIDKDFINNIINNTDNIDNISNLPGYNDTCNSLKKIVKEIMKDYVVYKEEITYEILSKNIEDNKYIYVARNYDVKAKVIFKNKKIFDIEIIEMNSSDLEEIENEDFIEQIKKSDDISELKHLNKSSDLLIELIKNVTKEYKS